MRVVVTGGAGFIGSHVVDRLVDDSTEVVVADALLDGAHDGVPDYLHPDATFDRVDLLDEDALARVVAGADAVCHQASMVGLGVDFDDVTAYCTNNDLGTACLLRALHRSRFAGRLVLASSMVVYGEGRYRCPRHGVVRPGRRLAPDLDRGWWEPPCPSCGAALAPEAVPESAPIDPRNVYAATKAHQEHLCQAFAADHDGVALTVLRYHNVFGPRMPRDTPYAGVAALFRSALERGEPPRVFEDGGQRRDFVHVDDVARANVLALTSPRAEPGTYNVASGTPRTVLDLARALADGAGIDPVVTGEHRRGDVRHVFASTARAASGLGFTATTAFDAAVADFARAALR